MQNTTHSEWERERERKEQREKKCQHSIVTMDVQACYKEYVQCYGILGLISTG